MSTVDIDKPTAIADNTGTLHIFQRGMTHEPNLCPECVFSEATQALIAQERTTLKAELLAKNTDFIQWLYMRDFGETLTTERLERAYKEYAANN